MAELTFRVLEGADRGRIYDCDDTPITIGREDGNTIQLNDERISRFHAKIQEDQDKLILTDLDSTNGTKINGDDATIRILRAGDILTMGRSSLLFGSRADIALRLKELRQTVGDQGDEIGVLDERLAQLDPNVSLDFELKWSQNADLRKTIHTVQPPDLPQGLTPGQTAQLNELLEYLHASLRDLIHTVKTDDQAAVIQLDQRRWQHILDVQSRLSTYLRQLGNPHASD